MNDINALKRQQQEKHPAFGSYLECMTRSLFSGLSTFAFGFSGFYFAQKLLGRRLPYSDRYYILISAVIGGSAAYSVTKSKTYVCQTAWVEAENPEQLRK